MGVWMYMADKRMINSNRSYMIMYTLQPQFLCSLHWHAAVKTQLHFTKIQTYVIHTLTLTCFAFIQCSFTIHTFQLPVYGLNYVHASDFIRVCAILILACSYICNNVEVLMQYLCVAFPEAREKEELLLKRSTPHTSQGPPCIRTCKYNWFSMLTCSWFIWHLLVIDHPLNLVTIISTSCYSGNKYLKIVI